MPFTITTCRARVNLTRGGRSQHRSGICIQQGGNRAGKQKAIWSCPSEGVWRRYAEQLPRQIFVPDSPPAAPGLKASQVRKQVKGKIAFVRNITVREALKERSQPETPLNIDSMYCKHILQHGTDI